MSAFDYIDDFVSWLPTTIFILIILFSTLFGFIRGYRKSMIFLINSLVSACICLVLYFLFKDSTKIDELMLTVTNFIMGSDTGLQDMLNVSPDCSSIREVLLEFIPSKMNFIDGLSLILKDNGAYLLTLIELAYSVIFAIIFYVLYLILNGILAIIYYIFYPDIRYKRKNVKKIMRGQREHRYAKRRTLGVVIGFTRGLISAIIYLSFIGTIFFIVSGGDGTKKTEEFDFGNDEINSVYNAYNSISEYGSSGIFQIFNTFKDNDNTPYYLFAADIVLSGELKVNEVYTNNIIFREELATYVGFSRDVLSLMLKYGGDDVKVIVAEGADKDKVMNKLISVMMKPEFQVEFEELILDFDSKVYISGLTLSLIDSIISNINEFELTSSLDDKIKDLLCILFKDGYLSESIPYERELKVKLNNTEDPDLEEYNLGHISASDIVNKENVICAFKILNYVLAYNYSLEEDADEDAMLELIESIIPYLDELSIFYPENSEKLNKVYRRLYAYVQYNFMEEDMTAPTSTQLSTKYYIDEAYDSIDWVYELNSIVDCAKELIYMYKKVDLNFENDNAILDLIFSIYNPNDVNYSDFSVKMDKVIAYLSTSKLLPEVLSSNLIYTTIENALVGSFENYQMPKLQYSNVYDKYGSVVEFGEVYHLLMAIKAITQNQENYTLINYLMNDAEVNEHNAFGLINDICELLTKPSNEKTIDYLLSSRLIRSVLSSLLGTISLDGNTLIYADKTILEADGSVPTNIIIKEELNKVIYLLPDLLSLLKPMIYGDFDNVQIAGLLEDESLLELLDSILIEGTISNIVVTYIKDIEEIIIPRSLLNGEGYISTSASDSELKNIINVVKDLNLDLAGLIEGNIENSVDDLLNNENLGRIFDSKLLHYTLSYYITTSIDNLITGFTVVIPDSTKDVLVNDSINSIIKKESFLEFLDVARELMPSDEEEQLTTNQIIKRVVVEKKKYLSNIIISATIINYLANDAGLDEYLTIPTRFKRLADKARLEAEYNNKSIWYDELYNLCTGLDELFNISASDDFDLNNLDAVTKSVSSLLEDPTIKSNVDPDKLKLEIIYSSKIVAKTLSNELDKYLTNDLIKPELKYSSYVYDSLDGYYKQEQITNLAYAISALGLSLDTGFDNSILSIPTEPIEKQKVYDSLLARGLITNMVDNVLSSAGTQVIIMNQAYDQEYINEFKIYNQIEIDVFLELLGDDLNLIISGEKDFDISVYTLTDFKNVMFYENNDIRSYILTGTMSKTIIDTGYFYIPKEDYNYNLDIISVESMIQLIDSMVAADFDTLDVDINNFEFPEDNVVADIAKSRILRATLSKRINISSNDAKDLIVGVTNEVDNNGELLYYIEAEDYLGNSFTYLTETEFINLVCSISELLANNKSFEFNMDQGMISTIARYTPEQKDKILKSCVVRTALNSYFVDGIEIVIIEGFLSFEINYEVLTNEITDLGTIEEKIIRNLQTEEDVALQQPTYEQFMKIFDYIYDLFNLGS